MILFHAAYRAVRRAAASARRRDSRRPVPLTRLVWGEFAHLIRRLAASITVPVAILTAGVGAAVEVGLSSTTPGPVLEASWRRGSAGLTVAILLSCWALYVSRSASPPSTSRGEHPCHSGLHGEER